MWDISLQFQHFDFVPTTKQQELLMVTTSKILAMVLGTTDCLYKDANSFLLSISVHIPSRAPSCLLSAILLGHQSEIRKIRHNAFWFHLHCFSGWNFVHLWT